MLRHGIINAQLDEALARLRHKDRFVISDSGLPVQPGIEVIDLALVYGVPRFEQVLDALSPELVLECGWMAIEAQGTKAQQWVADRFDVPITYVPHDGPLGFKAQVEGTKFVIRTGETTPYANVIFRCGVPF